MPQQLPIPGTELPRIEEIEVAAENYRNIRDRRMKLTEEEITAKTALMQSCIAHMDELPKNSSGNHNYRFDDQIVEIISGKPNVKVKTDHGPETDEDQD
jgi:hypothetical protein